MGKTLKVIRWGTIGLAAALLATMVVTSPDRLGPFGITLWFVGLCAVLAGSGILLQQWLAPGPKDRFWRHLQRSVLVSVLFTAVMALNGLRQLSARDIILLVILGVVVNFYMRRIYK